MTKSNNMLLWVQTTEKKMTYEDFKKKYGEEITVSWRTGGIGGGNCWGDGDHYGIEGDDEPDLDIDRIIMAECPNISYMKFRQIEKRIVRKNWEEYEYYGNESYYSSKTISTKDLYDILFSE